MACKIIVLLATLAYANAGFIGSPAISYAAPAIAHAPIVAKALPAASSYAFNNRISQSAYPVAAHAVAAPAISYAAPALSYAAPAAYAAPAYGASYLRSAYAAPSLSYGSSYLRSAYAAPSFLLWFSILEKCLLWSFCCPSSILWWSFLWWTFLQRSVLWSWIRQIHSLNRSNCNDSIEKGSFNLFISSNMCSYST
ncbi:hypothetical protein WA026_017186 [Henosepilachna vigintioctopunctata]|uniref:Cuticle protein 16.5-like n=1 Tax=Henosepilachna vigintioctopunctata TaxID=420089 RepID=A0AAW1UKQ0_9CUCU